MNPTQPEPKLSIRVLAVVQAHGPLTFTQIVHATRAHRGNVWRALKLLEQRGHVTTLTRHGRVHYVGAEGGAAGRVMNDD